MGAALIGVRKARAEGQTARARGVVGGLAIGAVALVTVAGVLALTLAGYVIVLVAAPADFLRLLNRSVDRLLLHVWPATVFTCFLVARAPEDIE